MSKMIFKRVTLHHPTQRHLSTRHHNSSGGHELNNNKLLDDVLRRLMKCFTENYYLPSLNLTGRLPLNQVTYGFALLGTMFKHGYSPDVTTYTSLINGLVRADRGFDAIELFKKVIRWKLCDPNEVTYGTIINGLCKVVRLVRLLNCLGSWMEHYYTN
ncbi:tetratricopeptide-like helical domain-containing protein [Artemisia annua]|uniref:Tetratricopeptide-like helical domain-containing protein n=1 Tax=Artemisia annua TaxID=35608 RepID=A0A2U1NSA0_ARTAN|nr:tetratricopeptide-like helical domain-containing protein [Artemisia annua]